MLTYQALERERDDGKEFRVGIYLMIVVARLVEYNDGLGCIKVELPVPLDRYLRYYYYNSPLALALYNTHFLLTFFVRSFYTVGREGVFFGFCFGVFFLSFSLSLLSRAFLTYVLWIHNTEFELGKIDNRWRRRRCDLIFFSSPFRMVDSVDPLFGWRWVDRFSEVSKKNAHILHE